ncbi:MAG: PBSX family phage terminase large subunit [Cellvibrionaceae bacterium]
MSEVRIPKIFKPLDTHYRYKVMYGGRGSSKSWSVARKLLLIGVQRKVLVLCTRELQKSIKQSVHRLLRDQIEMMELRDFYTITDTSIKGLNGTEFIFMGIKFNTSEIKSTEGVDICWIEEAENLSETSWDTIDPTIRKEGSEIWITFNPRFKFDYLYQLFVVQTPPPNSWVEKVNYEDNPYFTGPLVAQMEHMKEEDYEKYLYVFRGELKQLAEGAIFGRQVISMKKEGRVRNIPIEPSVEVHTFWDLGKNDHTAIWFMQNVGSEYRMIDYYENRLQDIDHYCRIIKEKNYLYGRHYMPHDVEVELLGMTKNRKTQFEEGGIRPIEVVPRIRAKNEAIEMARKAFPSVYIDEKKCERGLDCLSNYRYQYNDERDTHNVTPHHDWASNGADAFMQFAQGYSPYKEHKPVKLNNIGWGGVRL